MRRAVSVLVVIGLVLGGTLAAAEPPKQPLGLGQLIVTDPQTRLPVRLNLARYHVHVILHPPVALVQIDQSFYNPFPRQQEGTYAFNLPDGAAVSRFAMYTGPAQLIEGELVDRSRAANIYQSIVNQQRDPAILEEIGNNLFRMRVFPIFPRDTKRVLLDYTLPVAAGDEGWYGFELPLMSDLEPVWDFAITGTIRGPMAAGSASSPSHADVKFARGQDGLIQFELKKQSYSPQAPFTLRFQQRPVGEATVRSFVGMWREEAKPPAATEETGAAATPAADASDEKAKASASAPQCEFLATLNPSVLAEKTPTQSRVPSPADVLILADTSGGSADPAGIRQIARKIAGALRKGDRFRLGCVDVDFRPLTGDWVAPASAAAERAFRDFDGELFLGESDYVESFANALKSLPKAENGRRQLILYAGDGALPQGRTASGETAKLLELLRTQSHVPISAVLVEGDQGARLLMDSLARETGGRRFHADRNGHAEELFHWISAGMPNPPKIVSVKADGVAQDDLFVPAEWLPGRPLEIFGRRKSAGPMKLEVKFEYQGKTTAREWMLTLKDDPDDMFVGRFWANRKLAQLRSKDGVSMPAEERQRFVNDVVTLSQEWTLLTPQTAFLVLEKEEDYAKYGIARQLRHVYWKPAEALPLAALPPEALTLLNAAPHKARAASDEQFSRALEVARRAIKNKNANRALAALDAAAGSPLAALSEEFKSLKTLAASLAARDALLRNLGPQRGWFDRQRSIGFDSPATDLVWQLLYGYGSAGRDDEPGMAALAKRVTPPKGEIELEEFLKWCGEAAGLDLVIDRATLTDEGVAIDQPVMFRGIRSMSLESLLKLTLAPVQLVYLFEDGVFKITTSAKAGEKLSTRLYPVSDLIQSVRSTDYSLLVNPDLDRELLSNHRLTGKLNRRLAVEFDELPLEDVIDFLGEQLDDNVILDRSTLTDEGVASDAPVTLKLRDASVRSILAQVCEPMQLTFTIENEALVITTAAKAGEKLQTRIHPGQGIVFDLPPGIAKTRQPKMAVAAMGGMGGFGGGMMGGAAGGAPASTSLGAVSQVSIDGDAPGAAVVPPDSAEDDFDLDVPPGWLNVLSPPFRGGPKYKLGAFRRSTTTAGETINLITATIQPDSWEELSGPGSILYFPGAVGFVVRQTQAVHEEIGTLLERLRKFPPVFGNQAGYVPARVPNVGPNDIDDWDVRGLVDLLTGALEPDTWEDLSGPGSILMYAPKLVLSIRQTQEMHRQIRTLLTALRRARYLARQGKSWKSFDIVEGPWFTAALGVTDLATGTRQSELPEPEAEEMQALAVLAEPLAGTQTWRSLSSDSNGLQTTTVRQRGARSEFEFEGRLARVEGDEAAVAYPGITLVERGPWGEALRRIVDGRLPWLPHRNRRELARLFVVTTAAQTANTVQLRFGLPGAAAGNDILVTIDRKDGLPTEWESRLDGEPVLRLKFADRAHVAGKPCWKTVLAEDAAGRELERWELSNFVDSAAEIPALERGWNDFVVLDLRDQERGSSPPLVAILQGLRLSDWKLVNQALAKALEARPKQPFLLLVKAWSLTQQGEHDAAEVIDLLRQVAHGGSIELLRPFADQSVSALDDGQLYELLFEQPVVRRRVADWENLARVAERAGRPGDAIAHWKAAIEQAGPAGDEPDRELRLVQLLLETRRTGEAVALAQARAARKNTRPEEIASLAEALHQWGAVSEASKLIREALADKDLTGKRRQKLLRRRANLETGLARWRTLLEAVESLPADSIERAGLIHAVLGDLTDAAQSEQAGELGNETRDKTAQAAFRLRQAELYLLRSNVDAAADIAWKLYETKELPADRFEWLCGRLAAARQDARLIRAVEDALRAGKTVGQPLLDSLAVAYEAQGRTGAARRARTNARDLKPPPAPPAPVQGAIGFGGGGFFDVP